MLNELKKRIITSIVGISALYLLYLLNLFFILPILIAFPLFLELIENIYIAPTSTNTKLIILIYGITYAAIGITSIIWHIRDSKIIGLLAAVWSTDTAAFFTGRYFKGALLAPTISPKKTIAGFLGAVFAGAIVYPYVLEDIISSRPLIELLGKGIFLGAIFGAICQFGDLSVSIAKRRLQIKDSSAILPGHGGIWDRCDSLFAGAIFNVIVCTLHIKFWIF